MIIKYKSNLWGGLMSLLMGLSLFVIIPQQIAEDFVDMGVVTSRTIPYLVAILFICCGISLLFQNFVLKQHDEKELLVGHELKASCYILCLVAYAMVVRQGFLLPTCILSVVTLAFTKCKNKWYYGIAVVFTIILYFIFKEVLNVRMP